jgi:hypothetical protein
MKRLPVLLVVILAIGCRERGRPDPNIRMAVSHEPETVEGAGTETGGSVPAKLVVPPEVTAAFSGVRIGWKDSQTGKEGVVEVPIGGKATVPESDLEVRTDVFLTTEEITSTGTGEENPAARIAVAQGGKDIFTGWIFKRFPDVHPFQHPRFSLKLEGGVPRKTA